MKKIGKTIIEGDLKENEVLKTRNTVRAIILKNNLVYMLYSKLYNDYIFPGGGIKDDENHEEALKRELKEELGANKIKIIKNVGYIEELRYGINKTNSTYKQTSYFYLCEIDSIAAPSYNKREEAQGLTPKWIEISEAINHNNKELLTRNKDENKGFITVIKRENRILKHIKENLKNAKIWSNIKI